MNNARDESEIKSSLLNRTTTGPENKDIDSKPDSKSGSKPESSRPDDSQIKSTPTGAGDNFSKVLGNYQERLGLKDLKQIQKKKSL